mmetsp:Transcript_64455/g.182995  ORF Transcript_64455/g.182995 Transcript_64455/m.182995 type:complete len:281 (+) Transcript_64455:635-1477(+)
MASRGTATVRSGPSGGERTLMRIAGTTTGFRGRSERAWTLARRSSSTLPSPPTPLTCSHWPSLPCTCSSARPRRGICWTRRAGRAKARSTPAASACRPRSCRGCSAAWRSGPRPARCSRSSACRAARPRGGRRRRRRSRSTRALGRRFLTSSTPSATRRRRCRPRPSARSRGQRPRGSAPRRCGEAIVRPPAGISQGRPARAHRSAPAHPVFFKPAVAAAASSRAPSGCLMAAVPSAAWPGTSRECRLAGASQEEQLNAVQIADMAMKAHVWDASQMRAA